MKTDAKEESEAGDSEDEKDDKNLKDAEEVQVRDVRYKLETLGQKGSRSRHSIFLI